MRTVAQLSDRTKRKYVLLNKLGIPLQFRYLNAAGGGWHSQWRTFPDTATLQKWLFEDYNGNHGYTCIRRQPKPRVQG